MKRLLLLLLVLSLLFSCQKGDGKNDDRHLVLRYADNQPEYFPTTKAARYFAELVYARTDGKIDIRVYGNGELGGEVQCLQQIQFGGLDFARFSLGTLSAYYPKLNVLMLPYLYTDSDHMWRVLDGKIGDDFLSQVEEIGVFGLCWFDAGARSFYTRMPISSLEDMKGLLIRVQENDILSSMVSSLGADTVQIPYGDVYSALQMGKVDGAENNMPSYFYTGHFEPARYFFVDEHFRLPEMVVMSRAARNEIMELGPEYLEIVRECARESGLYERKLWKEEEQKAFAQLESLGVVFTFPSNEEQERIRRAMEVVYDDFTGENALLIDKIRSQ